MKPASHDKKIPVNVFTGFLGSGKTTIIKNLLLQIERPEKVIWIKNEYGDENIDELMLRETNVRPKEILNGCLCCVLIGRLGDAIDEVINNYAPERIIIETSGTAWPGPIVWEVRRNARVYVDSVITIIDALNFTGYDDVSYAAKMQNEFVDLVVINKYPQGVKPGGKIELDLEHKLDDVYATFAGNIPKVKSIDGKVSANLLMGLDSNSMKLLHAPQTIDLHVHEDDVDVISLELAPKTPYTRAEFMSIIAQLPSHIIRIKGVVPLSGGSEILNWVLGRGNWEKLDNYSGIHKLVLMGRHIMKYDQEVHRLFTHI